MPYGIDYAPLSNEVRIGTVRNGLWQKWEAMTFPAIFTVCQWIERNYPEGMALGVDGMPRYEITVSRVSESEAGNE